MADRVVLHVDMDAFYAAVERLDDPSLEGEPVVVGADPEGGEGRGVVATASYEAREHGIHSAQPISRAWARAPEETVWLRPRIDRYKQVGERIFDEIAGMVDVFEAAGIDEAYADVTERCGGSIDAGAELAREIQDRVRSRYDLTCSIGVGPNKLVAKIASDRDKPDGLTVVAPDEILDVIGPLDADVVPGVGPKTAAALEEMGIETVRDLAEADVGRLRDRFGKRGPQLAARARGEDDRPVDPGGERKSIGTERTFSEDLDPGEAAAALDAVADEAADRLRERGLRGRTVTVKIRLADFETFTRSRTVGEPIDDPAAIRRVARRLLDRFGIDDPVRLLGVRISNLDRRGLRQATLDEFARGSGANYTPRQADTPPMSGQERIGTVTHYFGDIDVAVIDVESGQLAVGDRVRIVGGDRDFTFRVDSMEVDHEAVEQVGPGDEVAVKVPEKARDGYEVYLAGEEE